MRGMVRLQWIVMSKDIYWTLDKKPYILDLISEASISPLKKNKKKKIPQSMLNFDFCFKWPF